MAEGQQPARVDNALVCLGGSGKCSRSNGVSHAEAEHVAQVFSKSLICPPWLDKE